MQSQSVLIGVHAGRVLDRAGEPLAVCSCDATIFPAWPTLHLQRLGKAREAASLFLARG